MTTLLHLVSGQTMQNILPILALKPDRIVPVLSDPDNPAFVGAAERTKAAVALATRKIASLRFDAEWLEPISLNSQSPSVSETLSRIEAFVRGQEKDLVINYTGGTKNMSIGAWAAAEQAGIPSIYCDTPNAFLSGGTGDLPVELCELPEVASKLTVPVLLASQGLIEQKHWKRGTIPESREALGEVSFDLVKQFSQKFRQYRHQLHQHGYPGGRRPKKSEINLIMEYPVPAPLMPEFQIFLDTAVEAGLLRKNEEQYYYKINPNTHNPVRRIEKIAMGLSGGPFEALVHRLLTQGTRFSSVIPNLEPIQQGGTDETPDFGESDFLAYEPGSVSLTLISCKATPPQKQLEHLESLISRKATFGGLFARTLLCVESGGHSHQEQLLRTRCRSLGIDCAIGEEIPDAFGAEGL